MLPKGIIYTLSSVGEKYGYAPVLNVPTSPACAGAQTKRRFSRNSSFHITSLTVTAFKGCISSGEMTDFANFVIDVRT